MVFRFKSSNTWMKYAKLDITKQLESSTILMKDFDFFIGVDQRKDLGGTHREKAHQVRIFCRKYQNEKC